MLMLYYIYIIAIDDGMKYKLATLFKSNLKAPLSIATTLRWSGCYSIP